jgi:predicted dienelactone hydrolase
MKKQWTLLLLGVTLAGSVWSQVGMRSVNLDGQPMTLVYPTDQASVPSAMGPFTLDVALNAKPRPGNQRLVVMSHGTGGSAITDHQLAATLAKAGFIVAQPLHAGDNFKDTSKAGPESWKTRPLEMSKAIDLLAKDPVWGPLFDATKVGVHGMSAGGGTAIAVAGGQWNMLTMIRHCGSNLEADIGFCFNGLAKNPAMLEKRRAQFRSGAKAPEMFLPAELKQLHGGADSRVKAVTLSVPVVAPFTPSSLAAIKIPVGVVSASEDGVLAPAFHSSYLLAHCKTCTTLVDLKSAGHFDLLAPWPESVAQEVAATQMRGGLPNPKFNPEHRAAAFTKIAEFFQENLR